MPIQDSSAKIYYLLTLKVLTLKASYFKQYMIHPACINLNNFKFHRCKYDIISQTYISSDVKWLNKFARFLLMSQF